MTTITIKEMHLAEVRNALKNLRSATKPQLAEKTGLSVVTINSLIKTLLEENEVIEEKETQTNGGRPAAIYSLNKNHRMALIFGTYEKNGDDLITASVINTYNELTEPCQQFTELTIANLDNSISYYLNKYPAIQAVIFALPAKVKNGRLIFSDYKHLEGFPLQKYITDKYHISCIIENDIRVAILGYFSKLVDSSSHIIAGLYIPKKYSAGIGVVVNGNILSGTTGLAGEIEYLSTFKNTDWKNRTFEQTIDLIKTVCVMYNPDKLIIYDSSLTDKKFELIEAAFSQDGYEHFKPAFIISPEIEEDYMSGLCQLASQYL